MTGVMVPVPMKYNCTEPMSMDLAQNALMKGSEEQPQLVSLPILDLGFGWEL